MIVRELSDQIVALLDKSGAQELEKLAALKIAGILVRFGPGSLFAKDFGEKTRHQPGVPVENDPSA